MNSESDQERSSSHHHHRPRRNYDLFLTKLPRLHATLLCIVVLCSTALCICYIVDQATRDLVNHQTFAARCAADPVPPAHVRQTVIDRIFNGTSPWENFPPPHAAPLLHPDLAIGWGSSDGVFERLIRDVRPRTIVEVGTFLGASTVHMAWLTWQLGLETQILCIDDFRGWPGPVEGVPRMETVNGDSVLMYQFMRNVVESNATDSVMFLPFSTKAALGALCEWGVYGDLVEVDADHDFHSAWVDINMAYKVLRPGGVIFGHDYFWEGVWKAVHMFAQLHGLRVVRDGDHWVMY